MVRTISATTNSQGDFAATFQPLATEAGTYQYAAGLPGAVPGATEGQFNIVGMTISSQAEVILAPGVPVSGSQTITNLGPVPLTGLTVNVVGAPANIQVQATLKSTTLGSAGSVTLDFTVTASDASVTSANVIVLVQSSDGAEAELTLPITVLPLVPMLAAEPGTLVESMLVGQQTIAQFSVVNNGGASSDALQVVVPQATFLSLTSPENIAPLAPGASTTVTLQLLPAADLPLGSYTGTISLVGATDSLNVPFQFLAVSQAVGNVVIDAQDELTFFTQGAPLVAGASVILSNTQTAATVASGTTGTDGTLELDALQVGTYNVLVQAQGHNAFQGSVTVQAGMTATVDAFMTSQLVTYEFNVTPILTEDQYTFTVNTTFTTHVPLPVVTTSPPDIDFNTLTFGANSSTQVNVTLTNQGLIAAQNVGLHFDSNDLYEVTPLISSLGVLPAESSVTVPVTIQRLAAPAGAGITPGGQGQSTCGGYYVQWAVPCEGTQMVYTSTLAYVNFGCPGVPPGLPTLATDENVGLNNAGGGEGGGGDHGGGSGPGGSPIGGTSGIPGGPGGVYYSPGSQTGIRSFNLCDPKDAAKLANAAIAAFNGLVDVLVGLSPDQLQKQRYDVTKLLGDIGKFRPSVPSTWVSITFDLAGLAQDFAKDVGKAVGKKLTVVSTIISVAQAGLEIYNQLSDPPQNVTPELSAALAQLQLECNRLETVADSYTEFFGSPDWVSLAIDDSTGSDLENNWLQEFLNDATSISGNAQAIGSSQQAALLAMQLPAPITLTDATNLIARWNNTLAYYALGITNQADVPPGQSANFIAADVLQADVLAASNAVGAMQVEGYSDVLDAVTAAANSAVNAFTLANDTNVCATVQLKISQQVTIARSAFDASFELDNQKPSDTLTDVSVNLQVFDMSGDNVTSLFYIGTPTLQGLTAVDGTGTLAPDTSGTANWTIIPTNAAAADGITNYLVEGTLSYFDNVAVSIPILPSEITVYPAPSLHMSYFLQQNVYGDDPFTPQIETPQPFALGLLVSNTGPGNAGDFTITSSQPQIVDNQKGLLLQGQHNRRSGWESAHDAIAHGRPGYDQRGPGRGGRLANDDLAGRHLQQHERHLSAYRCAGRGCHVDHRQRQYLRHGPYGPTDWSGR